MTVDIFVVALVGTVLGCWLIVFSILTYLDCKSRYKPLRPKKPCKDCYTCKCGDK